METSSGYQRIEYAELSRVRIAPSRNAVISECSKGGFTLAQQLEAPEGDSITSVFLKGAFHVEGLDELIALRDAVNIAIEKAEKRAYDEQWDDVT